MTTLAKLLAEKQQLIEWLEKNPDPQEREAIERLLVTIEDERGAELARQGWAGQR